MDEAKKKAGVPHSLSRKEEKANKRNTDKKRRQLGKKEAKQMENFDLIKQLQAELDAEKARQNEPQKPAEENPFAKAEEVARQLGLTEQAADPKSDMARLVKHYKGKKMSKDQMREKIAHDLEMLEYSPAQVSRMTKQVLAACCSE